MVFGPTWRADALFPPHPDPCAELGLCAGGPAGRRRGNICLQSSADALGDAQDSSLGNPSQEGKQSPHCFSFILPFPPEDDTH